MRVLLDTNVLIDYFTQREPYAEDAFRLRIMQEFGDIELWASIQSFSDIAYILRGATNSAALQQAFLASLRFLHVCSLDQSDLAAACLDSWTDLEDCLIEQCAKKLKADFILTRDLSGFEKSRTTTLAPQQFFTMVAQQYGLTYEAIDA